MSTLKQIQLAKLVSENVGRRPVTELMVEAGYAPSVARARQKRIQQGLGFLELLEKNGCSNKIISDRLKDGINALTDKKRKDLRLRKDYLELIMKAKGLLKEQEQESSGTLAGFIESMKDFNFDILIAIKQRCSAQESTDVTPING